MAHQSENATRLAIRELAVSDFADMSHPDGSRPEVWLFALPFGRTIGDSLRSGEWFQALEQFARGLNSRSIVAVLTSAQDAAETLSALGQTLHFQLWVAVKLDKPVPRQDRQIPESHAALLVLSRYRTPLRHTKTRIEYTFCPACDKTTKDYGGKKHTYHAYGTLVSDVWRDIAYAPQGEPRDLATRLADLFGLEGYETLHVVDLTAAEPLAPTPVQAKASPATLQPEPTIIGSRLINGDSLAELRELPDNCVDFCFADPPYNLAKRYDSWDDAIDVKKYLDWCDTWIDELARVLRPGCTCAVLNIPILAVRHFRHMRDRLSFQSWIVWEGLSLPVRMIMPAHYATVCFSKGAPRPLPGLGQEARSPLERAALSMLRENYCVRQGCAAMRQRARAPDREPLTDLWWDIHRLKHNSRRVDHPCQLPPALMRRLIALFTHRDEIVLDPFNGAGTTTLCADALERRYIGIELSEKYHSLARSRHKLLQAGGDPFEKVNGVPQAKNSRVERIGGIRYEVSKKTLQLEVKRVARMLGRVPSRNQLEQHGKYSIRYYDEYFISWGEVCAAARTTGMSETRNVANIGALTEQPTLFDSVPSP